MNCNSHNLNKNEIEAEKSIDIEFRNNPFIISGEVNGRIIEHRHAQH